jgi:hypothetical protein
MSKKGNALVSIVVIVFVVATMAMIGYFVYVNRGLFSLKATNDQQQVEQLQKQVSDLKQQINTQAKVPSPTVTPTPTPTLKPTTAQAPACKELNMREGKFKSDKCYTTKDYNDLVYYVDQYNSAVFDYNAAQNEISVTCNGSSFFKNDCSSAKSAKDKASSNMSKYTGIINGIIARGKSL